MMMVAYSIGSAKMVTVKPKHGTEMLIRMKRVKTDFDFYEIPVNIDFCWTDDYGPVAYFEKMGYKI